MCGIAGIIGNDFDNETLYKMLNAQKHRGPDYTGVWEDNNVSLGHNRLSIIDLSKDANQPMLSYDNELIIVFNGEIYNYLELKEILKYDYPFQTQSDTEVLIAAYKKWGYQMLDKLNGMFAFAIWDKNQHKLFAARDRFGVKPFYYSLDNTEFLFASEIKALWAAGINKEPNEKVWSAYFQYGSYGMPDESFWKNIKQLPGGHFLIWENNRIQINKWYDFVQAIQTYNTSENFEQVRERYEELLKESIRLRFRSDVPVGFNISGGLDSSTLLTFVNLLYKGKNIEAYTFYTGDARYDELPWVEEMIKLTGNPLIPVKLSYQEAPKLIEEMALYQDEPYGGLPTVAYGNIFTVAGKRGTIVLLDGQGMDEQWAGYDYYIKQAENVIQGVKKSPFRSNVLNKNFRKLANLKPNYPKPFNDKVKNLQYRDLFYTKIPRALRFNDRASMKASVELREPFLDYRMVELAFVQPLEYKIKNNQQKYMLRKLVAQYLSDKITYAPKRPLQTPQREWLSGKLHIFVEKNIEKLLDSPYSNWFEKDKLIHEWKKYLSGDRDSSFHIWQWVNAGIIMDYKYFSYRK